jgi:hypothetical protein
MRHLRQLLTLTAAALVGSTLIAGTARAQTPGYYVAVPAAQPAKPTLMTRETPWSLRGNAYVAARAPERDAVLCQLVAKKTGALAAFTVAGNAYDADQLAKCNAVAKGGAASTAVVAR